ncbi:hypothetical protein E2C01_025165 [Portunus trituberculatus]|uniref:Uncharacterized protein n=1 Tax=Portunus trituberculatus TaxID=210409 RepID=A0A5B7EFT3_PORTR|nr:hypothetical protein [Portunus trituberculatus]
MERLHLTWTYSHKDTSLTKPNRGGFTPPGSPLRSGVRFTGRYPATSYPSLHPCRSAGVYKYSHPQETGCFINHRRAHYDTVDMILYEHWRRSSRLNKERRHDITKVVPALYWSAAAPTSLTPKTLPSSRPLKKKQEHL